MRRSRGGAAATKAEGIGCSSSAGGGNIYVMHLATELMNRRYKEVQMILKMGKRPLNPWNCEIMQKHSSANSDAFIKLFQAGYIPMNRAKEQYSLPKKVAKQIQITIAA